MALDTLGRQLLWLIFASLYLFFWKGVYSNGGQGEWGEEVLSCAGLFSRKVYQFLLTLQRQSQQLSSALSSACDFKNHLCKRCGPRSDCSFRSSLIWVRTVCRYAKNSFEKFARIFSRRHKQTTFSDAVFLGALRVNKLLMDYLRLCYLSILLLMNMF